MVQWHPVTFLLLPHSKKVLGVIQLAQGLSVEFACSPHLCLEGFLPDMLLLNIVKG